MEIVCKKDWERKAEKLPKSLFYFLREPQDDNLKSEIFFSVIIANI